MKDALSQAWNEGAQGYDRYFVPRFAPWIKHAVDALAAHELPAGPIVAPCCGTAPELEMLAARLPDRDFIGVDFSSGMIELAKARFQSLPASPTWKVADASDTSSWPRAAGIISGFGLQQMPEPAEALKAWTGALMSGGVLSVVLWEDHVEDDGPFFWLTRELQSRFPARDVSWQERLHEAVQHAGGQWVCDDPVRAPMHHESAEIFWEAMSHAGPMRALASAVGADLIESIREGFLRRAPAGPITHEPTARHLLVKMP